MNSVVWNCRGVGAKNFPMMIKDIMRIYKLDFTTILEPRISRERADAVIRRIGLVKGATVEARGFSGGLWCL